MIRIQPAWRPVLHPGWRETRLFRAVFMSESSVGLSNSWLFDRDRWKKGGHCGGPGVMRDARADFRHIQGAALARTFAGPVTGAFAWFA